MPKKYMMELYATELSCQELFCTRV